MFAASELRLISAARFGRYRAVTDSDSAATELYRWNARLGGAYTETLAWVEIALRNALHEELTRLRRRSGPLARWDYTEHEWFTPWFQPLTKKSIRVARSRSGWSPSRPEVEPPIGKVVAELTFGFWVRLLAKHYEASLWTPGLRHAFPVGLSRSEVHERFLGLSDLRNRVAHHEPIFAVSHQREWLAFEEALTWLDPALAARAMGESRIPRVLDEMPRWRTVLGVR